ncbi:MAG TPA: ABC transporter ATP-binding protein [Thermoanaerobaculia bacterium]|jgi:ABC-type multidrug transport system ATPase subunit
MLEVSQITVRRGARTIVREVSFRAHPGEILGVIGPNGAGKTTLFAAVAGVIPRDAGSVDGALFYVPDAIRPWPDQRVRWTLEVQSRAFGSRDRVDALLRDLDLERLATQPVRSLSKGETKRLNIALGLLATAPAILLDEPFDGLDFRQTRAAIELLRGVAASGRTLVLSIHQLVDAERVCDRLLLMNDGRSIAEGTLTELKARAAIEHGGLEDVFLALA